MMPDKQYHLPPPFAEIDEAIRMVKPTQADYLRIRTKVTEWFKSVLGTNMALQMGEERVAEMNFVDYQMTAEEIAEADGWAESNPHLVDELTNQLLTEGYRITFTWDSKNDCVVVSIIGKTRDNPNYDLCMTTRHASVRQTMTLALHKHFNIFANQAWSEQAPDSRFG